MLLSIHTPLHGVSCRGTFDIPHSMIFPLCDQAHSKYTEEYFDETFLAIGLTLHLG